MLSQTLALLAMGNHFAGNPPRAETLLFEPFCVDATIVPVQLPNTDDFAPKPL